MAELIKPATPSRRRAQGPPLVDGLLKLVVQVVYRTMHIRTPDGIGNCGLKIPRLLV
jgi:hypothetical protein